MLSSEPGFAAPAQSERISDRLNGPTIVMGASALYLLIALGWSAAGRGDTRFAFTAAAIGALAGGITLILVVLASSTTRGRRTRWAWLSWSVAAACFAASAIAALAVIWSDTAVLWQPRPVEWLHAAGGTSLFTGAVLSARRRSRLGELAAPALGLLVTVLPVSAAFLLAARLSVADWPATGMLIPGFIAIGTSSAGVLVLLSELGATPPPESDVPFGLGLAAGAWTAATLAQTVGAWSDSAGMLAFGRWLLPIAALGAGWATISRIRNAGAARHRTGGAAPGWPRWSISGGRVPLATVAALAVVAIALALVDQPAGVDFAALAVLSAGCLFARQGLVLQAERSRVSTLLMSTEELRRIANIDLLTGLPNRGALQKRLDEELERSARYHQPLSVCFIDIDHFKRINDTKGHSAGDLVLREVAAGLRLTARSIDFVARYGGEEFVILAPGTWTADALILGERLRAQIEQSHAGLDQTDQEPITISIGVAGYPEHAETIDELLARADKALYRSKNEGRNRVTLYSIDWDQQTLTPSPESS